MAWPFLVKKIAWGIGALSHCLLYQILFIELTPYSPPRAWNSLDQAGRHRPGILLNAVDEDGHLLRRLVDIDDDAGFRLFRLGERVGLSGIRIAGSPVRFSRGGRSRLRRGLGGCRTRRRGPRWGWSPGCRSAERRQAQHWGWSPGAGSRLSGGRRSIRAGRARAGRRCAGSRLSGGRRRSGARRDVPVLD